VTIDDKHLKPLYHLLGHEFKTPLLLVQALTHPSLEGALNYQRLEFVGDRVLGLAIAELLYNKFPNVKEGGLSLRLAALVRKEALAEVALKIGLDRHIRMAASADDAAGRGKSSILADVCEAVIGALYLDGGLAPAARFVAKHWQDRIAAEATAVKDAKSALQEWAQGRGLNPPAYNLVEQSGPDHEPSFKVEVRIEGLAPLQATGASKRQAEQAAAEAMLAGIKES
jgi:ribonuclease-3